VSALYYLSKYLTRLREDQIRRLYTMDTKALHHVLMNSTDYQKPKAARYDLSRIVGAGMYNYIYEKPASKL
jgi:hypothetical protein